MLAHQRHSAIQGKSIPWLLQDNCSKSKQSQHYSSMNACQHLLERHTYHIQAKAEVCESRNSFESERIGVIDNKVEGSRPSPRRVMFQAHHFKRTPAHVTGQCGEINDETNAACSLEVSVTIPRLVIDPPHWIDSR